jgi:hypothetical protein
LAATLIASITASQSEFPLNQLLRVDHAARCEQACYECLQRYGNQAYHGLLDWRLGLDYLAMLMNSNFGMHRPGTDSALWTSSWEQLRDRLSDLVLRMTPDPMEERVDGITLVRLSKDLDQWIAVTHPLWHWDDLIARYSKLQEFCEHHQTVPTSTFHLARRPAGALDAARRRLAS